MPLPLCVVQSTEITLEIGPTTSREMVALIRRFALEHNWPTRNVTYIMDLDIVNDKEIYTGHRYEISFTEQGTTRVTPFAQNVTYDGDLTGIRVQVGIKPKIKVQELVIPVSKVSFLEDYSEYKVVIRCDELFKSAMQEASQIGFPAMEAPQQTYTIKLGAYYLDQEISTTQVNFNPTNMNNTEDEIPDEYIMMLPRRPDHIRVIDVRLQYISLYWLSELFNKILQEREICDRTQKTL